MTRTPIQQLYFEWLKHQWFLDKLPLVPPTTKLKPLSKDMTCTNFSSSGSFRNILVFVESSLRSTRKSFWDSMISIPCFSSCVCSDDKSRSRHFERAF